MNKIRVLISLILFGGSLLLFTSALASQESPSKSGRAEVDRARVDTADSTNTGSTESDSSAPAESESSTASSTTNRSNFGRGLRLMSSFTVFLLAVFVGFEVINKVPPTLHTPLMSGSNAISGITIVGALLVAGHMRGGFGAFLGMLAVLLAFINVMGGFLVTHRMLMMFKKR